MNSKRIQSTVLAVAATVTLVAGAVSPAMARASDPAKPKPKQEEVSAKTDTRKYCMFTEGTGSRIPKKECRTRADWLADGVDPVELKNQTR